MLQELFGKSSSSPSACGTKVCSGGDLARQYSLTRFNNRLSAFSRLHPNARLLFAGIGITTLAIGANQYRQARVNLQETEERKARLARPIVVFNDNQSVTTPFNKENIAEWNYRTVSIIGRPIHSKGMMIPTISYGLKGFEYLVPLVTKENEDGSVQEGLILNLGFIPREYAPIYTRARIENVEKQTFNCVVTDGHHLSTQGGLLASNDVPNNTWEYANLKELAKHTGFVNAEQTSSCILEHFNPDTPNDERDCLHTDISSDYKQDYPYKFTRSGVLQQPGQMYWDLNSSGQRNTLTGIFFSVASALLYLAK